jgi:hypothetical protein
MAFAICAASALSRLYTRISIIVVFRYWRTSILSLRISKVSGVLSVPEFRYSRDHFWFSPRSSMTRYRFVFD